MDDNRPPYIDFPEYNEFSQSYLWPVTVNKKSIGEKHPDAFFCVVVLLFLII